MSCDSRRPARSRRGPLLGAVAALALLATSCSGGGTGSQEDLAEILQRDDLLNEEQAACISEKIFDQYGEDENALGKLSAAASMAELEGDDGVPGFSEFLATTVATCVPAGPGS